MEWVKRVYGSLIFFFWLKISTSGTRPDMRMKVRPSNVDNLVERYILSTKISHWRSVLSSYLGFNKKESVLTKWNKRRLVLYQVGNVKPLWAPTMDYYPKIYKISLFRFEFDLS